MEKKYTQKYTFEQLAVMTNKELGAILNAETERLCKLQRERWSKAGRIMFLQEEIEKEINS